MPQGSIPGVGDHLLRDPHGGLRPVCVAHRRRARGETGGDVSGECGGESSGSERAERGCDGAGDRDDRGEVLCSGGAAAERHLRRAGEARGGGGGPRESAERAPAERRVCQVKEGRAGRRRQG